MTTVAIKSIEKYSYSGKVFNIEVTPTHPTEDDQYYLHADNGIVVHNCHPRDNIALRHLAKRLDLGYDLFGAIMGSRDVQAMNMADFLYEQQTKTGLPIYILGKAYKPDVAYVDGSYSVLIGTYLQQRHARFCFVDPMTGDTAPDEPCIALLAHNRHVTYGYADVTKKQDLYIELRPGSVVVDPWREFSTDVPAVTVIHYGNTRQK